MVNFYTNKTVLVTGATGLIGSNLIDILMQLGANVIALCRNENKATLVFDKYLKNHSFRYIIQDISNEILIDDEVDFVFHAAGPISGDVIRNQPVDVICPNIFGTKNCLDFLKKQKETRGINGRLVLFSSATVYGENNLNTNKIVTESDTELSYKLHSPMVSYSQSKRMAEVLATSYYKQYGVDVVIARFSYVYGYAKFLPKTAFYDFIKKALNNEDIVMNNACLPRRDNIYVTDAINGVLCICEKGISGEAYNISSNNELENYSAMDEIANIISEVAKHDFGKKVNVLFKTDIVSERNAGIIMDNRKLKQLDWVLKYSLRDGIKEIFTKI